MAKEKTKISEKNLKDLHSLLNESNNIKKLLGELELNINDFKSKKSEVISNYQDLMGKVEEKAKASILEAGIPEKKVEEYTLDIAKGEVITRKEAARINRDETKG